MSRRDVEASPLSSQELAALGGDVDMVLERGSRGLRFPPRLEEAFERETGEARTRYLVASGLVALLIYDLFLITDRMMIPDVFGTALIVRLAILTPIALLTFLAVWRGPSPFLRESMEAAITVLASVSVMYLFVISNSANATYYHPGLSLVLMFGNVVVRLRFWFALVASVATIMAYIVTQGAFGTLSLDVGVTYVMYLCATAIFTLIANYTIERDQRFEYLVSLRERCQRVALTAVNTRLSELSRRDPLTGIANRRALDDYLERMPGRPRQDAIAVVMLDIDHFKLFNDHYGHQGGDECLQRVAHTIRDSLHRSGDMVARVGGEEFVVVLPGADVRAAADIADNIRQRVVELGIPHELSPDLKYVTVSAGVAALDPAKAADAKAILAEADAALYRAKAGGRNRVETA
jgi:diguanylate cyclase (GGDEF)-like protein